MSGRTDKALVQQLVRVPGLPAIRYDPGFPDHIRRVLDMYRIQ